MYLCKIASVTLLTGWFFAMPFVIFSLNPDSSIGYSSILLFAVKDKQVIITCST